jgi:benzoyl-CoA reductase/2-hydroxyglutaryl-CoA dehydratase subunit BcrC/BadD/HgdB
MAIIEEFNDTYKEVPNEFTKKMASEGRKLIGYICSSIPEEIIHSAGLTPIRIIPHGHSDTTLADGYMTNLNCSFARNILDKVLNGDYDFLDGAVFYNSCDHMRRMTDNWRFKRKLPFIDFLSVPHLANEEGIEWFEGEIKNLVNNIQKYFDVKITQEKLSDSIKLYNETRRLLQQLYDLRKLEAPKLWGSETTTILGAAMSYPKEIFNEKLRAYLKELEKRPGIENLPRLMIVGSEIDDPEYIKIIEDQNSIVVTDYNCFGSKYFDTLVDETQNTLDGQIRALTERYLLRSPCPRGLGPKLGHDVRLEKIKNLIKESYVDGVILERIKMCDLWGGETFLLDYELSDLGVPTLILEREYSLSAIGQMKTRVQAFLEML